MTDFGFETQIPVRYSDHDALGHVNNAAVATYLEEARIDFLTEAVDRDALASSMVVATMTIDYHAPIESDDVTVGVAVPEVGRTSFTVEYVVEADGVQVATAETVQVTVDGETGAPVPVPDEWRSVLEA